MVLLPKKLANKWLASKLYPKAGSLTKKEMELKRNQLFTFFEHSKGPALRNQLITLQSLCCEERKNRIIQKES